MKPLRRVAVLGAGTMGARIAAHFANAGFPVDLLDIVLPDEPERNRAALGGIESAATQRPVAFFTGAAKALIAPGNFEDDLGRVGRCQWIVEAVAENLEIKRSLWRRVAALRAPGSIVSTNTMGIPRGRSRARKCWIGWRRSAISISARAWCRARIRPTSSAIASAASSGRKWGSSPKRAITRWRKWTR